MTVLDSESLAKRIDDDGSPAVYNRGNRVKPRRLLGRGEGTRRCGRVRGCDDKFQLFSAEELVRKEHPAVEILRSVEFEIVDTTLLTMPSNAASRLRFAL